MSWQFLVRRPRSLRRNGLVVFALATAACADPDGMASEQPNPSQDESPTTSDAEGVAPTALIAAIKADLAARRHVSANDVRVISADSVVWRDLSLGCGKPTESYAQVEVMGFRIVLESGGEQFDYRARDTDQFALCEPGLSGSRAR